jgi:hypothetical protein
MRDMPEAAAATTLQYSIESLDEFRATAYHCGLQAIDKAHQGTLTPIYFTSSPAVVAGFDLNGEKTTVASSQNYYKIKNAYAKP